MDAAKDKGMRTGVVKTGATVALSLAAVVELRGSRGHDDIP
jgi:hypothetical protein